MNDQESLALVLAAARKSLPLGDRESLALAARLLERFRNPTSLLLACPREWSATVGMSRPRLELLSAVASLTGASGTTQERAVTSSRGAFERFRALATETQEVVVALFLDVGHRPLGQQEIFRGTLSSATARPREILRAALLHNAAALVVAHCHPSGDPTPSGEDAHFTQRLRQACLEVGLSLLDHLVVASKGYYSFRDAGELGGFTP